MHLIYSFLSRTSRKAWLLLLVLLQLLFMAAFHGLLPFSVEKIMAVSGGAGIPDAKMHYTFAQLQMLFQQYGPRGRSLYLQLQWLDMLYPLVYSTLLASLLFLVYRKTRLQFTVLIPFAAAFFDYAENVLLRVSIRSFPHMHAWVVQLAATATFIKWFLVFLAFFLLLFGAVWWLISRMKRNKEPAKQAGPQGNR